MCSDQCFCNLLKCRTQYISLTCFVCVTTCATSWTGKEPLEPTPSLNERKQSSPIRHCAPPSVQPAHQHSTALQLPEKKAPVTTRTETQTVSHNIEEMAATDLSEMAILYMQEIYGKDSCSNFDIKCTRNHASVALKKNQTMFFSYITAEKQKLFNIIYIRCWTYFTTTDPSIKRDQFLLLPTSKALRFTSFYVFSSYFLILSIAHDTVFNFISKDSLKMSTCNSTRYSCH